MLILPRQFTQTINKRKVLATIILEISKMYALFKNIFADVQHNSSILVKKNIDKLNKTKIITHVCFQHSMNRHRGFLRKTIIL